MVYVYYHIYAIDGVENIIDKQISLLNKHFNFEFEMNIGVALSNANFNLRKIKKSLGKYAKKIRILKEKSNEFLTLNLILQDVQYFQNNDLIFYFHTKGATRQKEHKAQFLENWRNILEKYNIEEYKIAIEKLKNEQYNSYGCLLSYDISEYIQSIDTKNPLSITHKTFIETFDTTKGKISRLYCGNFWWTTAKYAKTIDITDINQNNYLNAEARFIQMGDDWNPFNIWGPGYGNLYMTDIKYFESQQIKKYEKTLL